MNKQDIIQLLQTNDKAIARALVVLNERQTATEQNCETTINDNGVGFTPADARMGTSMAQFYAKRGYLTEKQLAYWKKPNVRGVWRICKYAGQLLEIAQAKAAAAKMMEPKAPVDDVGNMMEELMVLEEIKDNFQGDDFGSYESICEKIAFLKKEIDRAYKEMA